MKSKRKSHKKQQKKQQKKKDYTIQSVQKFYGYYMEDMDCKLCPFYVGKKKGCKLKKCCCEDEKIDAIANGRIKRAKRLGRWDK